MQVNNSMKIADVLSCSFPEWYPKFKHVTYKSITIALPRSFMDYLNTDSVVLPANSTHGLYTKSSSTAMNEDDDDPDLRDEDLLNQYEADWSTPACSEPAETRQFPDLEELDAQVKSAIQRLGGRVFPKMNWSSPKDAAWIAFDKSLLCTCPSDVYLLLKSSEFISHDTDLPFNDCEDAVTGSPSPSVEYCLVLREWRPPDPSTEFRCFVQDGQLIGICQRYSRKFYPYIPKEKDAIIGDIRKFFKTKILNRFQLSSYVFDITRTKPGTLTLIDFNPFGTVTDSILFSWDELPTLSAKCDTDEQGDKVAQFRCVEDEEGVRASDYANYALPRDIQDLTAGTDPYKFMDLMKMKIQKPEGDDSSTDEEDEADGRAGPGDGGALAKDALTSDEQQDKGKDTSTQEGSSCCEENDKQR